MRHSIGVGLLVFALALSVLGSGGFSAAQLERGSAVAVVEDDSAYIGYDAEDQTIEDGETIALVEVTNRFAGSSFTVTVEEVVVEGEIEVTDVAAPDAIEVGETGTITGTVECDSEATGTVHLSISVEGTDVSATIDGDGDDRQFTIECEPSEDADENDENGDSDGN